MENTQMIEPVFRIVGVRPCPERTHFSLAMAATLVKKGFFALLDRVGVCHAPRILCAHCLAAESPVLTVETGRGE